MITPSIRTRTATAAALALGFTGLGVTAASATTGPATTVTHKAVSLASVEAQLRTTPPSAWQATITADGGKFLKVTKTAYTPSTSTTTKHTTANAVRPDDYPVGCSLTVGIWQFENQIVSSSLTGCVDTATEIQMYSGIALSAWWGWDEQVTGEDDADDEDDLVLEYDFNCAGSGTHDFQTVTNGYVDYLGTEAQAEAYDEIDNVTCT